MDKRNDSASTDVLISIHQEYAEAILRGEKLIEFRKAQFPNHVSRVYLYSTSPIKKIVGYFIVKNILRASPRRLWNQYGKKGAIGYNDFIEYYDDSDEACGILVEKAVRYLRPIDLKEIDQKNVPQSFCYLHQDMIERLERETNEQKNAEIYSSLVAVIRHIQKLPRILRTVS